MNKILPIVLFLCLASTCFAQKDFRPGYIVTLQNDTLRGFVNYKGDTKSALECAYKVSENAENQPFNPNQIISYGFIGGKIYESKSAPIVNRKLNLLNQFEEIPVAGNGPVSFMQVLVKGTASLYFMKDANDQSHYFFQKLEEPIQELVYLQANMTNPTTGLKYPYKSKLYVGALKVAFKDCTSIGPIIDKTELKPSQLIDLFIKYNKCIAPSKQVISHHRSKSVFTWGLMAGLSFSHLNVNMDYHFLGAGKYNSKASPTAAAFVDFTLPFINDKLSINNAVFYSKRSYTANYTHASSDLAYSNYRVAYDFNYIRLETALRYTMPAARFIPYAQVGLSNSFMLTNNEEISSTKYYLNNPPVENQDTDVLSPILRKHQLGFVGSAGLKHILPNKMPVFLQANYEFNTGFTNAVGIGTRSHNTAILVGVSF
ncbi:hypothetical protein [Adhaeribacter terreus]|uniref:Outer membrane protein beta-barrel domain-containing protein n=1 Tax=Adhaeribacter terreus TaxID=529703 RepID=A0ABW0EFQ7_9BACT